MDWIGLGWIKKIGPMSNSELTCASCWSFKKSIPTPTISADNPMDLAN